MKRLPPPAAFTLCLLGVVLVLALLTLRLSPTSRWVPLIVVVPLLALILLELTRDVRGADAEEADESGGSGRGALLWALALPALVQILGISAGPGLFALLYLRLKSGEKWAVALAVGSLTSFGLWALFGLLLETSAGVGIPLLAGG
jgi:uncharacterized membrane protein YfcA